MTNKEIKQDNAIVINKIIRGVKDCEHKLVIAKLYTEDGKELGIQTITMKDKLKLDKELNLIRKPKTPYNLFTRNKDIARQYLINLIYLYKLPKTATGDSLIMSPRQFLSVGNVI